MGKVFKAIALLFIAGGAIWIKGPALSTADYLLGFGAVGIGCFVLLYVSIFSHAFSKDESNEHRTVVANEKKHNSTLDTDASRTST